MPTGDSEQEGLGPLRLATFVFLAINALFPILWLIFLPSTGPIHGDWAHLVLVAEHFVRGDWEHLYAVGEHALDPDLYWRYPPFALYAVAPLALLPKTGAYVAMATAGVATLIGAMVLMTKLAPVRGYRVEWALALFASGPAISNLMLGQSAGWLTLGLVVAATLWTRGRVLLACAVLGLFVVKPNWGIFFGVYALWTREWRGAAVMAGVAAGACLSALPLGAQVWTDFFEISLANDAILADYEPYKQITLGAFLKAALGEGSVTTAIWALSQLAMFGAAATVWRHSTDHAHKLGVAVLWLIAANPYASFYDALVLFLPATVWWSAQARWRPGRWNLVGVLIAFAWCWEKAPFTLPFMGITDINGTVPFSVVGPCTAAWLLLEAAEAHHRAQHQVP
ncbi:MAG: DUF2029 domain-containing protein [Proteobacteria bacterium]|nr:DUF2029 domain-containing protein [Pseudomonadota bacterium]